MDRGFRVDPRLAASSLKLLDLPVCEVRLQLDRRWPWLVLIPRRADLVELEDLAAEDRVLLPDEILRTGAAVRATGRAVGFAVEKLNIGALGNVVPQLHIHVLGRRSDDPAWPGPVWGFGQPLPYSPEALKAAEAAALAALRPEAAGRE